MLLDDARGLRAPTIRDRRKDRVCLLAETRLVENAAIRRDGVRRHLKRQ